MGAAGLAFRPWGAFDFQSSKPVVRVRQGSLVGTYEGDVRVFRGVPFAKPPVGDLRFLAPEPPSGWGGAREALANAPSAMQSGNEDSEDCLYLNVFAPKGEGPLPVYVWIHGGGNTGGGTNGQGPGDFVEAGIIVVTVAYRLGAFGYLKLDHLLGPEYAGSGSNGIRDQIAALRWVKENIAAFGGDPSQVTIGGQSAGAKNVAALMASPEAKGLFARAIMQSGSGHTVHSAKAGEEVTQYVMEAAGVKSAKGLSELSSRELLAAQQKMGGVYPHNYPFRPTTGSHVLPKMPVHGLNPQVPLLLGTNRDDCIVFFDRNTVDQPVGSRAISNMPFETVAPLVDKYEAAYPGMSALDMRLRFLTAEEYWMPSVRFAESHARKGGKTWMYRFDHANDEGYAAHGAEGAFVWKRREGWSMHETWISFIKGGTPGWAEYDGAGRKTMIYGQGGETSVVEDPRGDERRLWDGFI